MTETPSPFFHCGVFTDLIAVPLWVTLCDCSCGQRGCSDVWLNNLGKYMQGSGFDRETAARIADTWNAAELISYHESRAEELVEIKASLQDINRAYRDRNEARRVFRNVQAAYGIQVVPDYFTKRDERR